MPVTINANGLSIVHKGSGGEANATSPDVCLTTVGPAVVPIPYGNNAKSADLAEGTTTVSADGGNSIAIKGSKFAVSTGDADGDQKGISSGTIEDEAEFISASANVLLEGKGVARLSDQMTMNKGNTTCMGGVQNPCVTVSPELDIPSTCEICVRYPNGKRLTNAPYALTDEGITPLGAGALDGSGKSFVSSLMPGKVKLVMQESQDAFCLSPVRRTNPHCIEEISDDDFFDKARKRNQGFWQPTRVETGLAPWGAIGHELTTDRYFQDIVGLETRLHFTHVHPATEFSLEKSCETLVGNLNMPLPHTTEALLAYTMPMILEEGEILSAILRLAPYETTDRLLAFIRARGEGNPQSYLNDYDWAAAKKAVNESFDSLLKKLQSRLEFLRDQASKLKYAYLSDELFNKHINTIKTYGKGLTELIAGVFAKMQLRVSTLMSNTANVKVIKAADNVYSTEAGVIETVVNTTQTIDLVEPFMNEVPGKIADVLPIYPVRYGYANFFDTIMPAQAPPTLPEMASASGLNETGGYILRLLREGWIYIKEEEGKADNQQIHIFRYAQTETATGVIEKFEKYYFTNEENAQDGLTLDISSGATFYPFAFVTNGTQKISIAYSEHEWAADIIDKMNSDQEWRTKAMQQVDMAASDDFSDTATQDTLSSLVEDYRSHDVKWLADKSKDKPSKYGLDVFTTAKNYYLAADELVETMQKSHSEQKDGTLVALFDPVGRQADITYILTLMTAYQKAGDPETLYPRTIGEIVRGFLEHPNSDIQEMAKENIDEAALTEFFKKVEAENSEYKDLREKILGLYDAFAYKEMADSSKGSMDEYLKQYFDAESTALKYPEKEVEKLTLIAANIFDGNGASEEGQAALIAMINDAYEGDDTLQNSQNTYYIIFKSISNILLQCQDQVDWQRVISHTPSTIRHIWAQARATGTYGAELAKKSAYKLSANALSQIVNSFLPTYFEKVHGIVYTNSKVRVTHDELAKLLANHIDALGKSTRALSNAERNVKWARKLFDWADIQKQDTIPQYYELSEVKVVRQVVPKTGRMQGTEAVSVLDYVGMLGDGVIAGFSWDANLGVLYEVLAQSDYSKADPIERSGALYNSSKLVSALAALIADSAVVSRTGLVLANKGLATKPLAGIAQHVLPKTNAGVNRLNILLQARIFSGIIGIANIGMVCVAIGDGYDDWKSGNMGSLAGNVSLGLGSAIFAYGAVYYAITGAAIALTWGVAAFVLVVAGGVLSWMYGKGAFENLLYRCFWGKSDDYSFWHFTKSSQSNIEKRLKLAQLAVDDPLYQTAYQIEVQEFTNFLMQPSVEIETSGGMFSKKQLFTYQFVLPNFVWQVSELSGSIQTTTLDVLQPIHKIKNVTTLDESGTKALSKAIEAALGNPAKRHVKDGALYLTVDVELDEDAELFWYYKPTPDTVVPKRTLTSDGEIKNTYVGMKDNEPLGDE